MLLKITLLCFLLAAAIIDARTLTVPFWIPAGAVAARIVFPIILPAHAVMPGRGEILFAVFAFAAMAALSMASSMGGADAILAGVIGLYLGSGVLFALLLAFLLALPLTIRMRAQGNEHEYPFVPFLLAGVVLSQAILSMA